MWRVPGLKLKFVQFQNCRNMSNLWNTKASHTAAAESPEGSWNFKEHSTEVAIAAITCHQSFVHLTLVNRLIHGCDHQSWRCFWSGLTLLSVWCTNLSVPPQPLFFKNHFLDGSNTATFVWPTHARRSQWRHSLQTTVALSLWHLHQLHSTANPSVHMPMCVCLSLEGRVTVIAYCCTWVYLQNCNNMWESEKEHCHSCTWENCVSEKGETNPSPEPCDWSSHSFGCNRSVGCTGHYFDRHGATRLITTRPGTS